MSGLAVALVPAYSMDRCLGAGSSVEVCVVIVCDDGSVDLTRYAIGYRSGSRLFYGVILLGFKGVALTLSSLTVTTLFSSGVT